MRFLYPTSLAILLCIVSDRAHSQSSNEAAHSCIQRANNMLDEALNLMQKYYYRKESVAWDTLIVAARKRLNQSGNCDDAYEALKWCFTQMNERHSFIMPPSKAAVYNGNINSSAAPVKLSGGIRHELLEGNIAYVDVPWLSTADKEICTAFADSLHQLIEEYDQKGINKWIVDLRRNTGGNCWPMLAGLGALLGNGVYGYFVSDTEKIPFSYMNGVMMQGRYGRCTVTSPYACSPSNETIIVLTGANTSSAGEIVALAFKGKQNVYLYGEPTAGLTTANATYKLSDGSLLVLTVCKEADRNGNIHEGKILPDKIIKADLTAGKDAVKGSAMMFLQMD
jgi:C-terminal processing protease CtpA/Prc